jgi:3,4-dihydroxy-2-butanone 4-phosphate synthase
MSETRVKAAIEDLANGRAVIVIDDVDDTNEANLVVGAQFASSERINHFATHGRGLVCLCLTRQRAQALRLPQQNATRSGLSRPAFLVSIEAREGVGTGISAADRARTVAAAIYSTPEEEALVSPGHVFPVVAQDGGVLVRPSQTEAAVDLARLAGINPAAVVCGLIDDEGNPRRGADLEAFIARQGMAWLTIRDLIRHRAMHDPVVRLHDQGTIAIDGLGPVHWRCHNDSFGRGQVLLFSAQPPDFAHHHRLELVDADPVLGVGPLLAEALRQRDPDERTLVLMHFGQGAAWLSNAISQRLDDDPDYNRHLALLLSQIILAEGITKFALSGHDTLMKALGLVTHRS